VQQVDDDHFTRVAKRLLEGGMIPFLGAGANLCDRGEETWQPGQPFLPAGGELAAYLAKEGLYPKPEERDLMRVSQYFEHEEGEDRLYRYLRDVFAPQYAPTSLHRFLARVARLLADAGTSQQLLTLTTNYDDLMEMALVAEGLEYDVVWYEAKESSGDCFRKFMHRAPGKDPEVVSLGNTYAGLNPEKLERPAVLKLHGYLDRQDATGDSYVITEDSYIDYLSRGDVSQLIPIAMRDRMARDSFLFLGYSLADWNMRVILNRIWASRTLKSRSWAVLLEPPDPNDSKIEQTLWDSRNDVDLVFCGLSTYTQKLQARLPTAAITSTPEP
jgi:SIR2-like domain